MISFVVPVYRVEAYLNQCVSSILSQDFGELEIILVDDGSPDNCPEMCDVWSVKDDRIRVIHKLNGGLSDARNVGLEAAKGDYVWFIDSDDWLKDDAAEILKRTMSLYPGADVYSTALAYYLKGEFLRDDFNPVCLELMTGYDYVNKKYLTGAIQRFIIKRRLLVDNGICFYKGVIHEDGPFGYILMYYAQSVVCLPDAAYCYRQREESIMHSISIRSAYDSVLNHKKLMQFCDYKVKNERKVWFKLLCSTILTSSYIFTYDLFKTPQFKEFEEKNKEYINKRLRELLPYCGFKKKIYLSLFVLYPKPLALFLHSKIFAFLRILIRI